MAYRVFWGDLHSHCNVSYGRGTLERALLAAREHLDFCSVTGHATWPDMPTDRERYGEVIDYHRQGFATLRRNWNELLRAIELHDHPGKFVAIPSFEWHSLRYGDHNVYYFSGQGPILEREGLAELASELPRDALLIPHHIGYGPGARGIDWQEFDSDRSPVVEVMSSHGCSERDDGPYPIYHTMGPRVMEGTMERGLELGKRFGVIGSSDHHGGIPGHYGAGATAVLAEELTREGILDALRARRCYAVSGDRIELDFSLNGTAMGGEHVGHGRRELIVDVRGSGALDRVEVIKNNRTFHRVFGSLGSAPDKQLAEGVYKVRLEWGWGEKRTPVRWDGAVQLRGGRLLSVEKLFRGEEILDPRDDHGGFPEDLLLHRLSSVDEAGASWISHTFGNPHPLQPATSGLVLEIEAEPDALLSFEVNGRSFEHSLAALLSGSKREAMRGWLSEIFLIHKAVPDERLRARLELVDDQASGEGDHYYVRVAQENGQWAWSSPIWVEG